MKLVHSIALAHLLSMAFAAFAQTPLTVTGSAMYRERMALPQNAVFEATLEDVSRADAPSSVISSYRKESPGNPPIAFSIPYDPQKIEASHTYAVRVRITVDDKLMFTSTQRYQVLTQGHGSEIGEPILLQRVSGSSKPAAKSQDSANVPLQETYWKLVELNGKAITPAEQQTEAHLVLHKQDSRVSGSGGCNRLMGGYMVEGDALHFKQMASTMMACMHGMETEQAFLAALGKVEHWKVSGSELMLSGSDSTPVARFSAVALK
jgi:putative lipoprotein